jgi:hypothetical protein
MRGQTFKLENRWWVRFPKDIPYGGGQIVSRTAWAPIKDADKELRDEQWVEFTIEKKVAGSTLSGPVYEEYATINKRL